MPERSPFGLGISGDCERANMTYKQFLTVRVVGGILLALFVLWGFWALMSMFEKGEPSHVVQVEEGEPLHGAEKAEVPAHPEAVPSSHEAAREAPHAAPEGTILHEPKAKGVAFVEATISVLDYELNERFGGWRRNDILRFTDNVENIQLGVLEVVRRASVTLAERISRHGPSDVLDENLENAMNWFMVRPDRYWLPSPENKYNDGLNELQAYAKKLERGEARFYTRSDNMIPLFMSFAEILGSCDENLVKHYEEDGTPVSWFKVDDYFYYSKGVAKAMGEILHAVEVDFSEVLEARHAMDMLEGAIHACHIGAELDPWLVTDASLDGILANHRANMAASIAHAAYYVNVLIKTLST
jgi:hypothetical protein